MKIIKPYGQTRVEPNTEQAPRQRHFYKAAQATPTPLTDTLTQNTDALIAVWVSTIDKIFGKPQDIKESDNKPKKKPDRSNKPLSQIQEQLSKIKTEPQIDDKENKKKEANAKAQTLFETRKKLIESAWLHVSTLLPHKIRMDKEALKKAKAKWNNKLNLSTTKDENKKQSRTQSKPRQNESKMGCFGGKYWGYFSCDNKLPDTKQLIQDIHTHIHQHERRYGGTQHKREGLINNRTHSIVQNIPHYKQQTDYSQVLNQYAQTIDPIKNIFLQLEVTAKAIATDKNKQHAQSKSINPEEIKLPYKMVVPVIATQLRQQFSHLFGVERVQDLQPPKDENTLFKLHMAVKAVYKRITERSSIHLRHLPKDWKAMSELLIKVTDNQDINALIRLGKVIHYQWMNDQQNKHIDPNTLDFQTLVDVKVDESPFWTSLGQFKIKNDEAFLRMWRHCLSVANRSFSQWVNPTQIKHQDSDLLTKYFFEAALKHQPNLDQFTQRAQHLFADQATLLNTVDHERVLRFTRYLLNSLRNQIFHFKGLPQFLAENINADEFKDEPMLNKVVKSGESQKTTAYQPIQQAIQDLYQSDLGKQAERLTWIMQGLKVEACFTRSEWDNIVPHLTTRQAQDQDPLLLPRFSRLWQRANGLDQRNQEIAQKNGQDYSPAFFPKFPNSDERNSATQPWHQCRYSLLKWVYENAFQDWLQSMGASKEPRKWFAKVAQNTNTRAKEDEHAQSIAQKVLDNMGEKDLSPAKFMSEIISQTQKLSSAQELKHDAKVKATAQALEHFKIDWFVMAFEKFITKGKRSILKELLSRCANGDEPMIGAGLRVDEKLNFEVLKTSLETLPTPSTNDTADEVEQKSYIYFILHLMTNDSVSLLRHQLKKWWVLYTQWQCDPTFNANDFYIDGQQTMLYQRWVAVMDLYVLMQEAQFNHQYQETGQMTELPAWVESLYGADERGEKGYVYNLFHQGQNKLIPHRHLRLLTRYGYDQVHALLQKTQAHPIDYKNTVKPWLETDAATLAEAQKRKEALHKQWVKVARAKKINPGTVGSFNYDAMDEYDKCVDTISKHRLAQTTVLLQDEFNRYQLLMTILGRLVDYAGLWERDVAFICTALLHQIHQTQPQAIQALNPKEKQLKEGKLGALIGQLNFRLGENDRPVIKALWSALERMGYAEKKDTAGDYDFAHRNIRNHIAHFDMLHPDKAGINISHLIEETRELMSYDRKIKNAVSYSIVDIFKRNGLKLNLTFSAQHHIQSAQVNSSQIVHLKGEKKKDHESITENHHSAHYVLLVQALFT